MAREAPARPARRGGNDQVRIEDVARRAKVAPMTVSRALRTPEKVSEEARRKVKEAIAATGYVPNLLAGSLASNRTKLIAALVPNIGNPLFAMTLRGLSDVLRSRGYQLMIASSDHSSDEEEGLVRTFLGQRPCGLVLHETLHNPNSRAMLLRAGVPIVEIGDLVDDPMDVVVSYSNFEVARAATLHLGRRGYRRIALVGSPLSARAGQRRRGFEAGLAELRLEPDPELYLEAVPDIAGGIAAITRLRRRRKFVADAVLFTGNAAAVGALLECQRCSWAVPDQIAIATFDDTDIARNLNPPLTAVRIPRYEVGARAAELLVERLLGQVSPARRIDLGFEVIQRGTT